MGQIHLFGLLSVKNRRLMKCESAPAAVLEIRLGSNGGRGCGKEAREYESYLANAAVVAQDELADTRRVSLTLAILG